MQRILSLKKRFYERHSGEAHVVVKGGGIAWQRSSR